MSRRRDDTPIVTEVLRGYRVMWVTNRVECERAEAELRRDYESGDPGPWTLKDGKLFTRDNLAELLRRL